MKWLIVSADDFGMTAGVTRGIIQAIERGVVTSTSAMACRDGSLPLIRRVRTRLSDKIGVHLQLTAGSPVLAPERVPSLVDSSGRFPRRFGEEIRVDQDEVFGEWSAQIDALVSLGISPTHVDSHHGVHRHPLLLDVYCALARQHGLKARSGCPDLATRITTQGVKCPDLCEARWTMSGGTLETLCDRLRTALSQVGEDCVVELVTHPGYVDRELHHVSSYADGRAEELTVLCAPETERALADMEVKRIGFGDL